MVCAKERDLIIFTSCLPMDPLIKVFFPSAETIIIRKQVTNLSFTGFFKFTKYFFGKKKQEQKLTEKDGSNFCQISYLKLSLSSMKE